MDMLSGSKCGNTVDTPSWVDDKFQHQRNFLKHHWQHALTLKHWDKGIENKYFIKIISQNKLMTSL